MGAVVQQQRQCINRMTMLPGILPSTDAESGTHLSNLQRFHVPQRKEGMSSDRSMIGRTGPGLESGNCVEQKLM
jgi:hypothetical protein